MAPKTPSVLHPPCEYKSFDTYQAPGTSASLAQKVGNSRQERTGSRSGLNNKAVTGLAVACLALGIGLNTMMFSVTDGVLIQPLPYQKPDRIIVLHTTQKQNGIRRGGLS